VKRLFGTLRLITALLNANAFITALLPTRVASAHPLGNFSVNHYSSRAVLLRVALSTIVLTEFAFRP
jgi:hypothetical protein